MQTSSLLRTRHVVLVSICGSSIPASYKNLQDAGDLHCYVFYDESFVVSFILFSCCFILKYICCRPSSWIDFSVYLKFINVIYLIFQERCNKTVISSCRVKDAHFLVITGCKTANVIPIIIIIISIITSKCIHKCTQSIMVW